MNGEQDRDRQAASGESSGALQQPEQQSSIERVQERTDKVMAAGIQPDGRGKLVVSCEPRHFLVSAEPP